MIELCKVFPLKSISKKKYISLKIALNLSLDSNVACVTLFRNESVKLIFIKFQSNGIVHTLAFVLLSLLPALCR